MRNSRDISSEIETHSTSSDIRRAFPWKTHSAYFLGTDRESGVEVTERSLWISLNKGCMHNSSGVDGRGGF